jgi:AraC-like DNA-binding protein
VDPEELRIRQAASWLREHYTEEIELDRFFSNFGFSRRNFYRYWEKVFRITPKAYLRNLRLQEAERLLGSSSTPVEEIAWMLHFRDVSHFIRIFREKNGVTPLQFRRKLIAGK